MNWKRDLYILVIAQTFTSMGFSIIFPFLPFYIKELDSVSGLSIEALSGLVFSSQALAMALISPVWGVFADRYGRKLMVVRAMIGGAITVFLMGFVETAEQLIFLRICQGLLSGVISATSALAASFTPREKSGFSMGTLQVGVWSGVALGPLMGGVLADILGFRSTFFITGLLLFASGIAVFICVHENSENNNIKSVKIGTLFSDWKEMLFQKKILVVYVLRFLSSIANNMLLPILPLFLTSLITSKEKLGTLTGCVVGASSITSIAGGFLMARISDKIGNRRIVLSASFTAALFFIPQSFVSAYWQLIILNLLSGFCMGALTPSLSAMLAKGSQCGTEGSVYGFDNSIVAAGRAIAPLAGSIIAVHFNYRLTFVATGIVFLIMATIVILEPRYEFADVKKQEERWM